MSDDNISPEELAADQISAEDLTEYQEPTEEETAEMADDTPSLKIISLIGAYGTGKSVLADAIADEYGEFEIVDGYVEDLEEFLGISLGFNASYIPNLMVAFEREKADHAARLTRKNVIVVGSLVDTLAYAALMAEYHSRQLQTPQQQAILQREVTGAQFLHLMTQDVMIYTHYFYVKIPPQIEVPGQEPKFEAGQLAIDRSVTTCLEQLRVPVTELPAGDLDAQMVKVKEVLGDK